ncbi:hypothetical protein B0H14DRAFT_2336806, partial [Mycena olivaceomarginata]
NWLSPINFFLRHADIRQVRQPGTGEWLLVHPHFKAWESASGRTLWCHGIRASKVVDHLDEKFKNQNTGVACMYLNHKEAEVQTPAKLLSALWRQLVLGRDISPLAKELYQKHQEKQTKPTLDEVFPVLQQIITEFSQVYIVVDAVDEYPEMQQQILFKHLSKMGPNINFMITSRPHVTPHSSLPNLDTLEICATEADVKSYVEAQIKESPRLTRHIESTVNLREEILSKIVHTADGM